jgi:Tfp pilus assembly protein PilF
MAVSLQAALAAHHAGRLAEAERLYRKILRAEPTHFDALHCLGIIEHQAGRHERALGFFERALRVNKTNSQLYNNRANALNALNRPEEALADLDRAIALNPNDATLHYNRGNTLLPLLRDQEALDSFTRAVALNPALRPAWLNRGLAETRLGLYEAALATCDRVIADIPPEQRADDPDYRTVHWNGAAICLTLGDYERGWRDYEWRWQDRNFSHHMRHFREPLWLGQEDIAGRTILLHAEQGYGDAIQFCRYAPMVRALGARVILDSPPALTPLMRTLDGPEIFTSRGDTPPAFDFHCPLMSLPLAFGTRLETVPAAVPYLAADPARADHWREIIGPKQGLRVGLSWSGSADFKGDATRSAPLEALAGLILPGVEYVSVQKDMRPGDVAAAALLGVRHFGPQMNDFADAAALSSLMDLVISVDSAPVHVAGALGQEVWVLLHRFAEWRWLRDRIDSPWYPTARLFRQQTPLDWAGLSARVASELAARM